MVLNLSVGSCVSFRNELGSVKMTSVIAVVSPYFYHKHREQRKKVQKICMQLQFNFLAENIRILL